MKFSELLQKTERFAAHPAYLFFVAAMNGLDAFILIIPNDALLIPAVLAKPRQWIRAGLIVAIGSALGAAALASTVSAYGPSALNRIFPHLEGSTDWARAVALIHDHGSWGLSLIAASPLPMHLALAAAGFSHTPFLAVFGAVLLGRVLKYVTLSWIIARAPHLLQRLGIKTSTK